MIVPQSEIAMVKHGQPKRRQMWLPMDRGEHGERLPCPLELHKAASLQPRLFVKGVQFTPTEIYLTNLGNMTEAHARQQGWRFIQQALDAFGRQHGDTSPERLVWVVSFSLGDWAPVFRKHAERYLKAKGQGLTYDPEKGVRGEAAVTEAEQLQLASAAARKIDDAKRKALLALRDSARSQIKDLKTHRLDKETVKDLEYIERRLEKIRRELGEAA